MDGSASRPFLLRRFSDLAWSPDSKTVAFRSDMDPSGYDFFYTVPAEGGVATRLDYTLSPMGIGNEPVPLNAQVGLGSVSVDLDGRLISVRDFCRTRADLEWEAE